MAFYNRKYEHGTFCYYLGGEPKSALNVFATGYKGAAETLTKSLLRRRHFSDYEAYPVIFLYCHALELSLKHAIYRAAEFAGYTGSSEIEDRLYNTHKLIPLVTALSSSTQLLFPEDTSLQNLLGRVRTTCHELAAIDVMSFRYPIDTNGQPAVEPNTSINLRAFASHMSSLLEDIDMLNFGIDAQADVAQEAFVEFVLKGLT